ncbi:hypothetical protein PCE1_001075 [Barthelona sp. PCE]
MSFLQRLFCGCCGGAASNRIVHENLGRLQEMNPKLNCAVILNAQGSIIQHSTSEGINIASLEPSFKVLLQNMSSITDFQTPARIIMIGIKRTMILMYLPTANSIVELELNDFDQSGDLVSLQNNWTRILALVFNNEQQPFNLQECEAFLVQQQFKTIVYNLAMVYPN